MDKILLYPSRDSFGQHLQPIDLDDPRSIDGLDKTASMFHPAVQRFIDSWEPMDGHTAWLIDALGSDIYGNNINGDRFPKEMLAHEGNDYGHKTFEIFGYPFFHHINKDPKFAYGPKVPLAVWQPEMERVQVVAWWNHELCGDLIDRLLDGEVIDVSMGCFLAGTLITMADGSRKRIEDVKVGDMVITHLGRARRVTSLHRRPYRGEVHSIRGEAGMTSRGTDEHPFWVTPLESVKKNWKTVRWLDDAEVKPDWVHAGCLGNEHLLQPVIRGVETPGYVTRAFARFFGYYLAEGHPIFGADGRPIAVEFNTNRDDAIHNEIHDLCAALDSRNPPNTWSRKHSEHALAVDVYDSRLAELCVRHGGHGARDKALADGAILWHPEMQREMLGAYANGDGCGSGEAGTLRWSTASMALAFQIVEVLHRVGSIPSICSLTHKAGSGFSRRNTEEWVIHLGRGFAQSFRDVCSKVEDVDVLRGKAGRRLVDDYVVTPIRDHEAIYCETEVFNFEVEEDESYVANGYAVHNCRVPFDECTLCGNRARKRSQYCDHLRNEMNVLQTNGIRVGAINWFPKFFDISRVVRGAEKGSKFLIPIGVDFRRGRILKTAEVHSPLSGISSSELFEKVAGALPGVEISEALSDLDAKVADEKTAEIEKEVPSNLTPSEEAVGMGDDLLCGMSRLRQIEPDIPNDTIDEMASSHPLRSIFSTLMSLGVLPKPKEFQRIVLVSLGRKDDADRFESEGQCFGEHDHEGSDHQVDTESVLGGPRDISGDIGRMLAPMLANRSVYKPAMAGRSVLIIKRASAGPIDFEDFDRGERRPLPLGPLAVGLAALHGAFKQRMTGSGMAELGAAAAKNPVLLALLTALGIGAVEANRQLSVTQSNPFANDFEKASAAGGMGMLSRFLGLPAAAYVYSDLQEAKRLRGERLTRAEDFVRRNPDLTSIGLVFGAPGILSAAKSGLGGVGSMLKHSSMIGDIGSAIPMYALFAKSGPALPLAATGAALDVAIFEGLGRMLGSNAAGS